MTRINTLFSKGLLALCCVLLSACASFSDYTTAANQGDMAFIDSYLAEGGAVDERDGMGYTALHRPAPRCTKWPIGGSDAFA